MAKYIEITQGPNKGVQCFVRSEKGGSRQNYYEAFDGSLIRKSDCKEINYVEAVVPSTLDDNCRYRL